MLDVGAAGGDRRRVGRERPPGPGEVDLWLTAAEGVVDDAWVAAAVAVMPEDERARHDRFLFARSRRQFAVARALVRQVLARYTGLSPQALRFVANAYGRPELDPARDGLRFNLSHADGLAALAVARDAEIGVDVEDTARRSRPEDIADHFFAAAEVAALLALPAEQRPQRFFDFWTLKEAYIKARGMGLSIPLGSFAYDLSRGRGAIDLAIDPSLGDPRAGWRFVLDDPTPRHRLALAVRFAGGDAPVIRARWIWPAGPGLLA